MWEELGFWRLVEGNRMLVVCGCVVCFKGEIL